MTVQEWAKEFKAFINELQISRDDYKGIIAYIEDGAKLLKEQEPRVMTLEEVCTAVQRNDILFTECEKENQWITKGIAHFSNLALFNDSKYDNCKITFIRQAYDGTHTYEWYVFLKNYNKTWRCWTSRPTDAQQEATPWN